MWILLAFLSALFAGLTSILAKIGLKDTDSNVATALRTIVVLIFSWLLVFISGAVWSVGEIKLHTLFFLILSGMATGASWICYFRALQLGSVNKVVPIDKSSTILSMLFAMVILGETGDWIVKVIAIVLIATGTFMMVMPAKNSQSKTSGEAETKESVKKKLSGSWVLFAVLSAVFAALQSILGKIGIENVDSNLGTAIRTVVVLIMAWVVVFMQKKQGDVKSISRKSWIFIVLSGLATGLSWLCYYRALQDGQASVVVPIDKLSILVTAFFAVFVLKEKMSKKDVIGLIILTLGSLETLLKTENYIWFFSLLGSLAVPIIAFILGALFLIFGFSIFFLKKYELINGFEADRERGLLDDAYAKRVGLIELCGGAVIVLSGAAMIFVNFPAAEIAIISAEVVLLITALIINRVRSAVKEEGKTDEP